LTTERKIHIEGKGHSRREAKV